MLHFLKQFRNRNCSAAREAAEAEHLRLGRLGEEMAAQYLRANGYRLVATNYETPIGRGFTGRLITGEIDIIAYDETDAESVLCFVEVKTRTQTEWAAPESAVDKRKQRQIIRASRVYRRVLMLHGEPYRFDVIGIITGGAQPQINLRRGYFSEASYARSQWRTSVDYR
jgi:putative endonuclease